MTNNATGTKLNAREFIFGAMQKKATIRLVTTAATQKLSAASRRCRGNTSHRAPAVDRHGMDSASTITHTAAGTASMIATMATTIIRLAIVMRPRNQYVTGAPMLYAGGCSSRMQSRSLSLL
jgi:hypothetical protein